MVSSITSVESAEQLGVDLAHLAGQPGDDGLNRGLVAALAEAGLFEGLFAENGPTARTLCQLRQGLARSLPEAETAFAVQGLGGTPIARFGSEELRSEWVPKLTSGEAVPAFALTEPGKGSDAANLELAAERDGDGYRLSGEKIYISNAPGADIATVFARTTADAGAKGVTAFAVPTASDGMTPTKLEMLSPHPMGGWVFDGVYVSHSQVLGDVDAGFRVAMNTLDLFRPSVGAFTLGIAEKALSIAVDHASKREAFGQTISRFQGISHQLADVRVDVESSRHLVYEAAAAYDEGDMERLTGLAAMAKLKSTETAQKAVDVAIQTLGARGLEADSVLAHLYLEVRAPRIYEGTSEIQRNIVSREMFRGKI